MVVGPVWKVTLAETGGRTSDVNTAEQAHSSKLSSVYQVVEETFSKVAEGAAG